MFFLIPLNTDAPIYHWPFATVGLIVVNCLIYFISAMDPDTFELVTHTYWCSFGEGFRPYQWLTNNFLHAGPFHLITNMIFLWSFGIVVEGKLGWWKYLIIYLVIGTIYGFLIQLCMLGYTNPLGVPSGALGASAAIFGLLAICLIWAPMNEFMTFYFVFLLRIFTGVTDMKIRTFAMVYFAINLLFAWATGFQMSSEILHLVGGIVGLIFGLVMLQFGMVNCEDWDIFSVMQGKHLAKARQNLYGENPFLNDYRITETTQTETKAKTKKRKKSRAVTESFSYTTHTTEQEKEESKRTEKLTKKEKAVRRLRRHLKNDKPNAALIEYESIRLTDRSFKLKAADLLKLAEGLLRAKQWKESVSFYEQYLSRFPGDDEVDEINLRLAGVYVEIQKRPKAALRKLKEINQELLSEKQMKYYRKIEGRSSHLIDQGVIEPRGEAWN